jgi:hypothetical protein
MPSDLQSHRWQMKMPTPASSLAGCRSFRTLRDSGDGEDRGRTDCLLVSYGSGKDSSNH